MKVRAIRKSSADQCALESDLRADANPFAVDLCALTARCGEEFLTQRIVDHAVFHAAATLHADRDRELRKAVHEIRRAIEWIDDPDEFVVLAFGAAFLGEDRVIGIVLVDGVDDVALCGRSISVTKSF